jgi:hypothetical protein
MTNRDVIIAIDPDVGGSGVAVFYMSTKMFQTGNMTLPKLVDFLKDKKGWCDGEGFSLIVVVEASYLINANWHLSWDDTKNRAAAKGKQVGRNHEIGRQIVEFCKYLEIPYEEKLPLKKCWAGKDGKISHDELIQLIDGMSLPAWTGKTNQEIRDAMLIALDRSGLPLRMKKR